AVCLVLQVEPCPSWVWLCAHTTCLIIQAAPLGSEEFGVPAQDDGLSFLRSKFLCTLLGSQGPTSYRHHHL
ncbi:hypothetical protein LEMLEM_LOCUS13854, partial [Lemmus lemmus]